MATEIKLRKKSAYQMNPAEITINAAENPRKDYGDEEFLALKESIREKGVQYPVSVHKVVEDGVVSQVVLTHGFRRMTAVNELIAEGHSIDTVPVALSTGDRISILIDHMVLNGSKELTPVEKASIVAELRDAGLTYEQIGQATGLGQQMAYNYGQFALKASAKLKSAVENGTVSITTASDIVRKSDTKAQQDDALEAGVAKAQASGRKTVRNSDVPTVKASVSKKQFLTLLRDNQTAEEVIAAVLEVCNWVPLEEQPE